MDLTTLKPDELDAFIRGYQAAARGVPFDQWECVHWREGWRFRRAVH